jgi:hypothetical protein
VRRVVLASLALTLQLLSHVEATDRWPQFRGPGAGVADDDPTLPDTPKIVDTFKTMSPARDVVVAGPLVLVALAGGEVLILKEGA